MKEHAIAHFFKIAAKAARSAPVTFANVLEDMAEAMMDANYQDEVRAAKCYNEDAERRAHEIRVLQLTKGKGARGY